MSDPAHTPGPWLPQPTHYPNEFAIEAGPHEIALVYATNGFDEPTKFPGEANAHLIAAAPDLLLALREVVGLAMGLADDDAFFAEQRGADAIIERAQAAIAKATGAPNV